jgi:hypothetical protein
LTDIVFIKVPSINLIEIHPVGAAPEYEDKRTEMTKTMGALRNYLNAPKNKFAVLLVKTTP